MIVLSTAQGSNTTETARNKIRETLQKWTRDFNAGKSSEVCALFAPDLISNYQGQPKGNFNSLCVQLRKSLNDPGKSYHYSLRIEEILVCGDFAMARLRWRLGVARKNLPEKEFIDEISLDIFRRQPDGSWKISRFNAYPSISK